MAERKPTSKPELRPRKEDVAAVLRGRFNPAIFQPSWFALEGLLPKDAAANAKGILVQEQVALFELGDWLRVQVTEDRFLAATHLSSHFAALRDLVLGTFRILHHTPVNVLGINRDQHYPLPSNVQFKDKQRQLVRTDAWNDVLDSPVLTTMTMRAERDDEWPGYVQIRTEPSNVTRPGVFVAVNHHYQLDLSEGDGGCDKIVDLLERRWKDDLASADDRARQLVGRLT